MSLAVGYSPLCDNDKQLYQEYLKTCHVVGDGFPRCATVGGYEWTVGGLGCGGGAAVGCRPGCNHAGAGCPRGYRMLLAGVRKAYDGGRVVARGSREAGVGREKAVVDEKDGVHVGCVACAGTGFLVGGVPDELCGDKFGSVRSVERDSDGDQVGESGTSSVGGSNRSGRVGDGLGTVGDGISTSGTERVGAVVKPSTLENRKRRQERKERKKRRQAGASGEFDSSVPEWRRGAGAVGFVGDRMSSALSEDERRCLHRSRADRWRAENELKTLQAKRNLELEQAKDMTQLKKKQETEIMRQTEVNKVQVEKAFAQLARAGNVPGVQGSACTVVSESSGSSKVVSGSPVFSGVGSGSVSPNSSVSLAEIHAIQKDSLSKQKDIEEMQRQLNHLKFLDPEMYKKIGGGFVRAPTVDTGYTVDSRGQPIGEPPDTHWGGEVRADGKYHYITDEPFHLYDY